MKKQTVSVILFFILFFLIVLIYKFPFSNFRGYLTSRIHKESGILLVAERLYPTLLGWPGVTLRNVNITFPIMGTELDVFCDSATIRLAGIASFSPLVPKVSTWVSGLKKGGSIYLKVNPSVTNSSLFLELDNLSLEQFPLSTSSIPTKGLISGSGDLNFVMDDPTKLNGSIELNGREIQMDQQSLSIASFPVQFPALKIGAIKGKLEVKNGVIEVKNLTLGENGSDIKGTLNGDVRLSKDPSQTFVSLILKLEISQKTLEDSPVLASTLNSYLSQPGKYAIRWNATLLDFQTPTFKALGEKAEF